MADPVEPQPTCVGMSMILLIEAHRAAVIADEEAFDGDDAEAAERTLVVANEALRSLIDAPCGSAEDVQAKARYFAEARVRDNYDVATEMVDMIFQDGADTVDGVRRLLRSLLVDGGAS